MFKNILEDNLVPYFNLKLNLKLSWKKEFFFKCLIISLLSIKRVHKKSLPLEMFPVLSGLIFLKTNIKYLKILKYIYYLKKKENLEKNNAYKRNNYFEVLTLFEVWNIYTSKKHWVKNLIILRHGFSDWTKISVFSEEKNANDSILVDKWDAIISKRSSVHVKYSTVACKKKFQ